MVREASPLARRGTACLPAASPAGPAPTTRISISGLSTQSGETGHTPLASSEIGKPVLHKTL